jgi:hypothetical protein
MTMSIGVTAFTPYAMPLPVVEQPAGIAAAGLVVASRPEISEPPATRASVLADKLQGSHRLVLQPDAAGTNQTSGPPLARTVPTSGDVLQGVSLGQRVDIFL